mmetsp:Transcript_10220/g.13334  ORF Transcript_10220/g.13334 Transcript_10220/m.13334 type:complete len:752 (-) Transcript_10220:507-2762(-)
MHQGELRYSAASGRYKKVYGKPMKKHLSSHLRDFINNFIPDQVSMKFDGDTGDYMLRLKEPKKYVKKDVSLDFGEQMYPSVFKALGFCIDAEKAMKPFKFQKNKLPCPEFQRSSKCAYKDKCVFSHDHPPVKAMCKLFKLGECKKGDKCNDLHDHYFGQEPQEIKKKATHCRIYKYTGTCKFGDLCYYTHVEPEHVPQNDREMQAALEKMNADIQAEKAAKDVERITRECGRLVQLISTNKGRLRVKDIYELYKKTFGTGVYRNMKTGPVNFAMMHCPDKVDLWKNEEGLLHLILPDMITEEEGESTAAPKKKTNEPMKWMISVDKCGMIRDCLDELKQSTGANIRVATEYDMPPGSDERLVTISGDPEKCQAALDYIKDKAGGKPYEQRGWKSSTGSKGEKETVHVPLKSIGVILGSGGSEIKRITSESGANVQISTDMFIGDTKRIVTISGDDESREKAKVMIQERVAVWEQEYGHSEGDSICLKMVIPYVLIGHVLGKGGAFMRDVSNQCNVSVKINQDKGTFSRLCDSRPVMMIGTLENIFEAQRMIYDRLLSAPSNQLEEASRLSLDAPGGMGGMGGMGAMGGMGGMGMGGMEPMTMMMNGQKVMVIPQNMMMGGMQQPMMMMGGGMPGMGMSMGMMQQDVPVRPDKSLGIMGVKKHSQGMNVWIHPICMKYIIGKGGSNIKQLARDSGCEIEAQEKDEVKPNQNGVMIDIKGPGDNALMGFKLIHECLTGIKKSLNPLEKLSGDN